MRFLGGKRGKKNATAKAKAKTRARAIISRFALRASLRPSAEWWPLRDWVRRGAESPALPRGNGKCEGNSGGNGNAKARAKATGTATTKARVKATGTSTHRK